MFLPDFKRKGKKACASLIDHLARISSLTRYTRTLQFIRDYNRSLKCISKSPTISINPRLNSCDGRFARSPIYRTKIPIRRALVFFLPSFFFFSLARHIRYDTSNLIRRKKRFVRPVIGTWIIFVLPGFAFIKSKLQSILLVAPRALRAAC